MLLFGREERRISSHLPRKAGPCLPGLCFTFTPAVLPNISSLTFRDSVRNQALSQRIGIRTPYRSRDRRGPCARTRRRRSHVPDAALQRVSNALEVFSCRPSARRKRTAEGTLACGRARVVTRAAVPPLPVAARSVVGAVPRSFRATLFAAAGGRANGRSKARTRAPARRAATLRATRGADFRRVLRPTGRISPRQCWR